MKQGTLRTLGAAALGAAIAVVGAGTAGAAPADVQNPSAAGSGDSPLRETNTQADADAGLPGADRSAVPAGGAQDRQGGGQDQQGGGPAGGLLGGLPVGNGTPLGGLPLGGLG